MIEDKSGIFLAGAHKKARTPKIAPEGIIGKIGGKKKTVSRTQIQTLDLISEGEVEGLVSGQFYYSGQSGDIGYVSGRFKPYEPFSAESTAAGESIDVASSDNVRWLRSVYWNDVPLVDSSEQLNFANIDMAMVLGTADGLKDDDESSFSRDVTRSATKTRVISERLRGPNFNYSNLRDGHSKPTEDFSDLWDDKNPDSDGHRRAIINQRKYRVLNKNCAAVQVNVKIASLQYRELRNAKRLGDATDSVVAWRILAEPIFSVFCELPQAVRDTFNKREDVSLKGRITKGFVNSTQINLPNLSEREDFLGWEITVIKETADPLDSREENTTFVDSLTEIYRSSFTYPHSAIVSSKFSAEFFSQVPSRKFDMKLRKIKVPNNYNPLLRSYGQISGGARYEGSTGLSTNNSSPLVPLNQFHRTGEKVAVGSGISTWENQDVSDYSQSISQTVLNISGLSQEELGDYTVNGTTDIWDGTFKEFDQWTDNPAWVFYDLLTNKRYGLGDYVEEDDIDKWTLYKIGQYCDQLVQDGEGGLEPRFSANILLNKREESFKVINNMASVFRGIAYYGQGSIFAVQDSLKDPVMTFTNSNVLNGTFTYQSSNKKARHNVAIVKYLDRNEFYKPAVEYVKDIESIKKYGEREVETTAYGATSKTQAMRWGRWTLLTENMQTETIGFTAGLEGAYLRPGDVFRVSDSNRTEYQFGGRLSGIRIADNKGAIVTLDRHISFKGMKNAEGEDMGSGVLSLMAPTYHYDPVTTEIGDSRDIDDIRRSQILEYTFWTGHSLTNHTDAHGYISRMSGPSGEFKNGYIEITLTGTQYEADYINTSNYDFDINNTGIGTMPLTYTIHDPVGSNPEPQLYSALSVREADHGQIEVMGLDYASGKFEKVESDFETQVPESPFHAKTAPLKPELEQLVYTAADKKITYSVKVNQKTETDDQGRKVTYDNPDHNTSLIYVYHKMETSIKRGTNPEARNFFVDTENNKLGSPNNPLNDNYAEHLVRTFSARETIGAMEDVLEVGKSAAYHSFAIFSMNFYGEFSEGVYGIINVSEDQIDQDMQDIEIAGLNNDTDMALATTIGSNTNINIQDSTQFTLSWTLSTVGTSRNFMSLYGRASKYSALPTASQLFYLITIRAVDFSPATGLGSLYNFKQFPTHGTPWREGFNRLDAEVSNSKFIRNCFDVVHGMGGSSATIRDREVSISIRDLLDFKDTESNQINYLYEYGPPRSFDIVVEVINKERNLTSASPLGLGKYPTTDLDSDTAGTQTGWDRLTISNPRLPTFLLRKVGDPEITEKSFSAYSASSNAYSAANVDINSKSVFVTRNNKFYLLLRNYTGTKTPASSDGEGYWLEVDSICVATVSRPRKNILSIAPEKMIYYTRAASPTLTSEKVSSDGIGSERLGDIINGGFIIYSSNIKDSGGTSYFDRHQIYNLSETDAYKSVESITRAVDAEEIQNQDGTITQKKVDQEISVIMKKYEPDDSIGGEGEDGLDERTFDIEIPSNVIDSPSKFFCIYPYDEFDGSVINAYGKYSSQAVDYKRKAIALSNVIDLSWGS